MYSFYTQNDRLISKRNLIAAIASSILMLCSGAALAQSVAPSALPRLAIEQFTYEGGFRLLDDDFGVSSMNYSQGPIAYNPAHHSLFIVGHGNEQAIAEFSMPPLVKSGTLTDLRMAGSPRQVFSRVMNRVPSGNPQRLDRIGGLALFDGPQGPELVVNAFEYYDNGYDTHTTFAIRNANDLAGSTVAGYLSFQGATGHTSGWMSPIPTEWQSLLGGSYLTGQSSGLPIISRWSVGPSAFAFNPASIVGNPTVPNPIPTVKLLDFSLSNPLAPAVDLSNYSRTNNLWTHLSRVVYGMVVPGTRTYFTIGNSAGHNSGICYKCDRTDGVHVDGYTAPDPADRYSYYWLWDMNDLVRVKEGTLAPHDVRPYAYGLFSTPFSGPNFPLGGGSYDPVSGLLYLTVQRADRGQGEYSNPPVVVAYRFNLSGDATAPQVNITAPASGSAVSGSIAVTADASDNVGIVGVQFLLDGNPVGAEDVAAPYSVNVNTADVSNGIHSLSATARDAAGNRMTSAMRNFTINNIDTAPPTISNGNPIGTLVAGTTQTNLLVTTNEIATCRYGTVVNTLYSNMTRTFNNTLNTIHSTVLTGLSNGSNYTYYVRCQDATGNANNVDYAVSFTVASGDTTAPQVNVTSPTAGSVVRGTVSIGANAVDNVGVLGVQFRVDGNNVGLEDVAAPYSTIMNTASLSNGSHGVSAVARDAAGNRTVSAIVAITVNNVAVDLTPPVLSNGGPTGILVVGTTQANLVITTNEASACRYGTVANVAFGSLTRMFTSTVGGTSHLAALTGLSGSANGSNYTYYVRCRDSTGNVNTIDTIIRFSVAPGVQARTLKVGSTQIYKTIGAAAAAALDGDTVEIDAGLYTADYATWSANNLTIRGVNGRAHLHASGLIPNGKGIWVITGRNTTIENMEFSGATVVDRSGAGVRQEGAGLTMRNSYFHDNENGILTEASDGDILIEYSEFANNGMGDGYTHNIYVGNVRNFTLQHSYSHHTRVGHNVKSRAVHNHILYNRIMDEATGTSGYAIDIPNGGRSYVIGNLIQHGSNASNGVIVSYASAGGNNPDQHLFMLNNTIVNDRSSGTFVRVTGTTPALVRNNLFIGSGTVYSGPGTVNMTTENLLATSGLVNRASYDYHLTSGSLARDRGTDPGSAYGVNLRPVYQYTHPMGRQARPISGALDFGAYEY